MNYLQVYISAENVDQANVILDSLLKDKLILGGTILEGPAKFWWKGEIVEMSYAYILTYTADIFRDRIIDMCKKLSSEEVPMISFVPLDGNPELINLIRDTLIYDKN